MEYRAVITSDQAHLDSYNPAESQDYVRELQDEKEARRQGQLQCELVSWTLSALDNILWNILPEADRDAWNNFGISEFERIRRTKGSWDIEVLEATRGGHPTPIPSALYALAKKAYTYPDVQKHQALVRTLLTQLGTAGETRYREEYMHPAPSRQAFFAYAETLKLPTELRDKLANSPQCIAGDWVLGFIT